MRLMLLTSMFFHTVAENVVGFAIAAVAFGLPLYVPAVANLWLVIVKQD
jgi:hypothetical protein